MVTIYTVGHSNHPIEKILSLLTGNGITAIADVRSRPFSRRHPQFNKDRLAAKLAEHGIAYLFLGKELGARSDDPSHYEAGKAYWQEPMPAGATHKDVNETNRTIELIVVENK